MSASLEEIAVILEEEKFTVNHSQAYDRERVYINSIRRVFSDLADDFEELDFWIEETADGFCIRSYIADDAVFELGDPEIEAARHTVAQHIKEVLKQRDIDIATSYDSGTSTDWGAIGLGALRVVFSTFIFLLAGIAVLAGLFLFLDRDSK